MGVFIAGPRRTAFSSFRPKKNHPWLQPAVTKSPPNRAARLGDAGDEGGQSNHIAGTTGCYRANPHPTE